MSNLEIKKYQNIIEELNKDYENIKNNYIKLKQNYTDFSSKNDFLEKNFNNFINQIENILKDFPFEINKNEVNDEEILNPTQKIIIQITSLIIFCKELLIITVKFHLQTYQKGRKENLVFLLILMGT